LVINDQKDLMYIYNAKLGMVREAIGLKSLTKYHGHLAYHVLNVNITHFSQFKKRSYMRRARVFSKLKAFNLRRKAAVAKGLIFKHSAQATISAHNLLQKYLLKKYVKKSFFAIRNRF